MDDYFDDLGVASYLGEQARKRREAANDASRTVALYSNTMYEFRLDREELCVQDMDVLQIGESLHPLSLSGVPLIAKHIRQNATDVRGVLYQLAQPVDTPKLLAGARHVEGSSVVVEPRAESQVIKLQTTQGTRFQPGQSYALYATYTIDISSAEPSLFFIGSIQPRDFLDIRQKLQVSSAVKRVDLQLWSKRQSFRTAFYDGTDPVMRPPLEVAPQQCKLYAASRKMTYQISEEWHRSHYFGVFANWD